MSLRHAALLTILVFSAILAGCGGDVSVDPEVKPSGDRADAAAFTAQALNGDERISLASFKGRPVFLNFWASWCGPCREEMPDLQEFALRNPGVAVVGIATEDDPPDSRRFAKEVGATFPLAIDSDGSIAEDYRATGLPVTVIIDSEGRIANTWFGVLGPSQLDDFAAQLL